jgi:hypothetical protein
MRLSAYHLRFELEANDANKPSYGSSKIVFRILDVKIPVACDSVPSGAQTPHRQSWYVCPLAAASLFRAPDSRQMYLPSQPTKHVDPVPVILQPCPAEARAWLPALCSYASNGCRPRRQARPLLSKRADSATGPSMRLRVSVQRLRVPRVDCVFSTLRYIRSVTGKNLLFGLEGAMDQLQGVQDV